MSEQVTRTFLFTDIERSTELWESAPDAMRRSLEIHNRIIDRAINESGGRLFKRIGDATCSCFESPNDASKAAILGQIAIESEKWSSESPIRVRWSIHQGPCIEHEGDYLGSAVNQVARILNLAHPGQILLTEEAAKSLPVESVLWLGTRNLKGIATSVGIYQLFHPDLPTSFPPLLGDKVGESNLPLAWNQFVGRTATIDQLRQAIVNRRLVTIVGPGGAGKTRSAIEVASKSRSNFRHGVWLVNLAPLDNPSMILGEVARVLNHPRTPEPTDESVIELIRERNLLLILDNCEHVITESARLVSIILSNCPEVVVLATSRSPLQLPGEMRFPLESLTLPENSTVGALESSEAVRLFADRAQDVLPGFAVTEENAQAVFDLCHRMDGIPLALELAAAQLATYSVADIDRLIAERALKLRSEDPTALPHRQTTDTTIDWSYRLLTEDERWLCRRIAVFAGGAPREGIEAVAGRDRAASLQKLVYSSLVKFDPNTKRYGMLELVKEFMIDRLMESGDLAETRDRHLDWIVDLAQEARPHLDSSDQAVWLDRLDTEHLNVRAALTWSTNKDQRLRAAIALHWFWVLRGHVREGQAWLAGSLSGYSPSNKSLHAQAESALGVLYWVQGNYPEAKAHLEAANVLAQDSGDTKTRAATLSNLAMVKAQRQDLDGAEADFQLALEAFRELGDVTKQAHVLNNISVVLNMKGQPNLAAEKVKESISIYEALGDRNSVGLGLSNVASYLRHVGDLDNSIKQAKAGAAILLNLKDYGSVGYCLLQVALVEFLKGNYDRSAQLQGKTTALLNAANYHVSPDTVITWKETCASTKDILGVKSYQLAFDAGIQQPIEAFIGDL